MKSARAFTLIELIVVVAIAAILAAVAIPNYSAYVLRSKRAAAKTVLLEAAQWMERNYTASGCYDRASAADCRNRTGTDIALPTGLNLAPKEGRASYAVTVGNFGTAAAGTLGQQFTVTATPCGTTATTCAAGNDNGFVDGECGVLTVTNTGARNFTGSGDLTRCWQR